MELEAGRKALDAQLRELQTRVDEAEEITKREAKRIGVKLETRVNLKE